MARFTFFIGKGGVGKTTVSSAYAVHAAAREHRRSVLLLSTDPAHSLGDVLKTDLADNVKRVKVPGRLFAHQIEPRHEVERFLSQHRDALLRVIESGTFFVKEEIEPLLEASLPGMSEMAGLLALDRLAVGKEFDEIVVDTAPMGHTLRMFEVPEHLARFLTFLETAASRDRAIAQQFAHRDLQEQPVIREWRRIVERVRGVLAGDDSRIVLVTTPEEFALQESWRATGQLSELGIRPALIVLNRVVLEAADCARCRRRARQAGKALRQLRARFDEVLVGWDPGGPIAGGEALAAFGKHVFDGRALRYRPVVPSKVSEVRLAKAEWPRLEVPLTLTMGKGGVGKTTVSAGLAVHQRKLMPSVPMTICSIDPAPSLDDIFETEVGDEPSSVLGDRRLHAAEFDAVAAFKRWSEQVKQRLDAALSTDREGLHVDLTFDRRIMSALLDVVPPGIDEIFAVFRIREMVDVNDRVVIDMAPTGHALEVLRTPARLSAWARLLLKTLAAHRTLALAQDAVVEIAKVSQQIRALSKELTDNKHTRSWPVMLAEPMPDRETERLLRSLEELATPVSGIFVNRLLLATDTASCRRCEGARQWQLSTLGMLRHREREREILCVREFPREIAGKKSLERFTGELWRCT